MEEKIRLSTKDLKELSFTFFIIAYDGDCSLCNKSIQLLAQNDKNDLIRVIELDHPAFRQMRSDFKLLEEDSIISYHNEQVYIRSEALDLLRTHLKQPLAFVLTVYSWLPFGLKEGLYKFIAKYRKRILGKLTACSWSPSLSHKVLY